MGQEGENVESHSKGHSRKRTLSPRDGSSRRECKVYLSRYSYIIPCGSKGSEGMPNCSSNKFERIRDFKNIP